MKKYRFRLQRVLDVRRITEERARHQVAQSQLVMAESLKIAARRREQYAEHAPEPGPIPYIHHRIDRAIYELRAAAVLASEAKVEADAMVLAERLAAWQVAARDVDGLERLDERRRTEHLDEAAREDQIEADEIATRNRRGEP